MPFMKVQKQYFVLVRTQNNLLVVAEIFEHFIVVAINPYLKVCPVPLSELDGIPSVPYTLKGGVWTKIIFHRKLALNEKNWTQKLFFYSFLLFKNRNSSVL